MAAPNVHTLLACDPEIRRTTEEFLKAVHNKYSEKDLGGVRGVALDGDFRKSCLTPQAGGEGGGEEQGASEYPFSNMSAHIWADPILWTSLCINLMSW